MLEVLTEYAQVFNLTLFAAVIGWLFHISRLSRTSIVDQYNSKIAAKDQEIIAKEHEIDALRLQLESKEAQYESQIAVISHSRTFFERLATLPGDERLDALKLEYQMRMEELERREKALEEEIETAVQAKKQELAQKVDTIRLERAELEGEAKKVSSIDPETLSAIANIAVKLVRVMLP